ncbi:sucrase ferredoxin [Actinacidiphila acididurans]|uniref:sucrase ferredoxin n=1 Tax=Actinacidiphila acididurans TaxID=2784346 RepID=UPI0027DAE56A|nr:sucrase ferredoxin [Actinacidiphila acididurans]
MNPTPCSRASSELAEPLAGTAAVARTWLLVEQPGPWGAKALTASHLDPETGRALDRAADGTGVRVALIRRPGRHADLHRPGRHRVIVAHTAPGATWMRTAEVADPAELTALDFAALGAGSHGGFGDAHAGPPVIAVCTNGKRDRCCALYGRPLAAELASSGGLDVWEITHLGGHRFAPTVVVLPYGYAYGRVDSGHAKDVVEAARSGRILPYGCRGRSAWDRPGQAADLAVRAMAGEDRAAAVTVTGTEDVPGGWTVHVAHEDGRAWRVAVTKAVAEPPRPESCGAVPGTPVRMQVTTVEAVPAPAG